MPDLLQLFKNWWKRILAAWLIILIITGAALYLRKPVYRSASTALPASTYASDPGRLFNANIQALYTALGTADDLDIMVGTGQLDTLYLGVTDQFNLWDHYRSTGTPAERREKAARKLKKASRVAKTAYGELTVQVWDGDRHLAPQLANALMDRLALLHRDLQAQGNAHTLQSLLQIRARQAADSLPGNLQETDKLILQYRTMLEQKPAALIIVEKARVSYKPDQYTTLQVLIAVSIAVLLAGFLLAAWLENRKPTAG